MKLTIVRMDGAVPPVQGSKRITLTLFVAFVKTFRFEAFCSKYKSFMWTPSSSVRPSVCDLGVGFRYEKPLTKR